MNITTEPQVELIAYTQLDSEALRRFLDNEGARNYALDTNLAGAEELIRTAGKACYQSYEVSSNNKNLTRVRDDGKEYLHDAILATAHGSVLEHASMTFALRRVSRIFTHELVRHRAGTAFSQLSGRFVRGDDIEFYLPPELNDAEVLTENNAHSDGLQLEGPISQKVCDILTTIQNAYKELEELSGVDKETSFAKKKAITSALRRVLPQGANTTIIVTMNVRAMRHMILMRTALGSEIEIRVVFDKIAEIAKRTWPNLMSDFTRSDNSVWTCSNKLQPY